MNDNLKKNQIEKDEIKYVLTKQIVDNPKYCFSMPMIRHYLLHRDTNGLSNAVRKIGKRLYLRQDLFDLWLESKIAKRG